MTKMMMAIVVAALSLGFVLIIDPPALLPMTVGLGIVGLIEYFGE